jgi:hypothetical protein
VLPTFGGVHIEVSCTQPNIALSSYTVAEGTVLQWKTTGPDGVDYVLAVDATTVTGQPHAAVTVDTGTLVTSKPYRSTKCTGAGIGFAAPAPGQHQVRLFKYDSGQYVQVAQVPLEVR